MAVLNRTAGLSRFALALFATAAIVPIAGFSPQVTGLLMYSLSAAFVVMVGWIAINGIDIAAELYLRRFAAAVPTDLGARKHLTQVRILKRAVHVLVGTVTVAAALMTIPPVHQYGVSLFASAGAAGIIVGLAARPLLSNLIAGLQIAITQPIRVEDAVIVEGEWGWVEDVASTYVVLRLWDWRRMVVPLSYFIEKPFQNWTRDTTALIGSIFLYVDWTTPVDRVRAKLEQLAKESKLWDGQVVNLQVSDAKENTIELRALVSARDSSTAWDLRCEVREKLIAFLQAEYPHALPRRRTDLEEIRGLQGLGRPGSDGQMIPPERTQRRV
jgi:small-conductance mechanosensitive channel